MIPIDRQPPRHCEDWACHSCCPSLLHDVSTRFEGFHVKVFGEVRCAATSRPCTGSGGGGTVGMMGALSCIPCACETPRAGGGGGAGGSQGYIFREPLGLCKEAGRLAGDFVRTIAAPFDLELAIGAGVSACSYIGCWSLKVAGKRSEMIVTPGNVPSEGSSPVREPHGVTGLGGEETGEMFPDFLRGERKVGDPGQHQIAGLGLA